MGGKTSKTANSLVDLIASLAAEQITKGLNTGDIYGVIEVDGKVEYYAGTHPSYPAHIRQVNKKPPTLHLPKNRPAAKDYLMRASNKIYKTPAVSPTEYGSFYELEDAPQSRKQKTPIIPADISDAPQSRKQIDMKRLNKMADTFYMKKNGYIPYRTTPLGELQRAARRFGLRVETRYITEGRRRGTPTGYYLSFGKNPEGFPIMFNPRTKQEKVIKDAPQSRKQIDLAPNGNPSNLTPEQYKLVRTPAFKNWFGNWETDPENSSKVVDENGEPLPVSHFTNNYFDVFKYKETGFHFGEPSIKEDLSIAKGEQLEREINVFLNIRNPLRVEDSHRFDPPILIQQLIKNDIINDEQFETLEDLFYDIEEKFGSFGSFFHLIHSQIYDTLQSYLYPL